MNDLNNNLALKNCMIHQSPHVFAKIYPIYKLSLLFSITRASRLFIGFAEKVEGAITNSIERHF